MRKKDIRNSRQEKGGKFVDSPYIMSHPQPAHFAGGSQAPNLQIRL